MLKVVNSLNPLEYAQFEAYRRSTFRADLVSKFVASCLVQIERERFAQRANAKDFWGAPTSGCTFHASGIPMQDEKEEKELELRLSVHPPQRYNGEGDDDTSSLGHDLLLDHLVEPQAAPEITIAVSSLAKSYAQRLIQASRSHASEQGYDIHAPLLPLHIMEAYRQRSQAGLDPGFFLQPSFFQTSSTGSISRKFGVGKTASVPFVCSHSDIVSRSNRVLKPLAALASQVLYDQVIAKNSISPPEDGDTENVLQEE